MRPRTRWALPWLALVAVASASPLGGQEIKDPRPAEAAAGLAARRSGGPDGFGYAFGDGAEAACAPGSFVDIGATGAQVVDGDDTASGAVTLGAPFDLYGLTVTQLNMSSNGFLTTDLADAGPDLSNDCPLPAPPSSPAGTTGRRLYPLHDDLDLDPGIGRGLYQYFDACPRPSERCASSEPCSVFQWDDVAHFPGGPGAATWDMEVVLYHRTHDFVYLVGAGNPERGSGSTTGLQSDRTSGANFVGLAYACNAGNSIPDGTTVCVAHPGPLPTVCVEADLALAKAVDPPVVGPGEEVVFTLTVTNQGPGEAGGVVVTEELPGEVSWVDDDCGAGPAAEGSPGGALVWEVGALVADASAVCRVTVEVEPGALGILSSTATVTAESVDPVAANDSATGGFEVRGSALEIPTLGGVGLGALALLLVGSAAILLRRRSPTA